MAGLKKSVFRFYAHTLSDIYEILPHAYAFACPDRDHKEIQIVLAFARDYNNQRNYMNGEFVPCFDTSSIAPQDIQRIKNDAPANGSIKFFLSIGGRDPRFPFAVNSLDHMNIWITNATTSLSEIIQQYYIDGIDVYYEYINDDALPYFPDSIARVVGNLRDANSHIVTRASITVSHPLIRTYGELYNRCPALIDIVVYQCFTATNPILTPDDLVALFQQLYPIFPEEKILAGYSDWPCDKKNVKPAIFVVALARLISDGILGFSMWHGNPEP